MRNKLRAWTIGLAATVCGLTALTALAETGALPLIVDGKPRCIILMATMKEDADQHLLAQTGKMLADHFQQMSGAKVPVMGENALGDVKVADGRLTPPAGKAAQDAQTFILLGEGELTKRLGVTSEGLGAGGIVIKTLPNAVVIFGMPDGGTRHRGTAYAAQQFLERLGCRYLWPGELGTVVPSKATVLVEAMDVRFTPPIGQRGIRMMPHGPRNFEQGLTALGLTPDDHARAIAAAMKDAGRWGDWQCLGGDLGLRGGHAGAGLRGGWEQHGKAHPDWFALQPDGTRDQSAARERFRVCVSNLGLIEHVANDLIEQVRQKPETTSVSLSPNDGGYSSFCMCENCKKLDPPDAPKVKIMLFDKVGQPARKTVEYPSLSDRYVWYWNQIAARVTKVHPKLLFVVDAYSAYSTPPVREKLHPNLVVRYVPAQMDGWAGWQQAGAKRIYWRPNNLHSGFMEGTLNHHFGRRLAENMRAFTEGGMLALDIQGIYDNWATMGVNYYVAAKTAWNPRLSYDEILEDYCRGGFGAAADAVKKYWLRVEDLSGPTMEKYTPEAVAELRGILKEADSAAREDAAVRRRIAFLRTGLEFTAISAQAYKLVADVKSGQPIDQAAATKLMDRRWVLMREIVKNQPLAVNVAVVAGHDAPVWRPLKWTGPSDKTRTADKAVDDAWMYEDQTVLPGTKLKTK